MKIEEQIITFGDIEIEKQKIKKFTPVKVPYERCKY